MPNFRINHYRVYQYFFGSVVNVLLLVATLLIVPQPVAHAGSHQFDPFVCYGISDERGGRQEDGLNTLLKIDPAAKKVSPVGLTGADDIETISLGPDGHLYGANLDKFGRFNVTTGRFEPFAASFGSIGGDRIDDVDSLAYNPNERDQMYAVFRRMGKNDVLFVIDIATGRLMPAAFNGKDYLDFGGENLPDIDDLIFDFGPDGASEETLLGLVNNRGVGSTLVKINTSTGSVERIGTIKDADDRNETIHDIEGIAFWNDGKTRKLIGSTGENVENNSYKNALFEIHYASGSGPGDVLATELFEFDDDSDDAPPTQPIDIEGLACVASVPAIDIEKATNGPGQAPQDADEGPGPYIKVDDPVTWTYVVKNTGQVALKDVKVSDDQEGAISCPQDTLQVNESMICTAAGVSVAGNYANVSNVVGTPVDGQPDVTDQDPSHYHARTAAIDIEKATNGPGQAPQDADEGPGPYIREGLQVTWTYVVKNTGQLDLQNVRVSDDKEGAIECPKSDLAPGEPMTCTHTGTARVGQYANNSRVDGSPVDGSPDVSDEDPSHYYGTQPAIDIKKYTHGSGQQPQDADTAPGPDIVPGFPVYWTYVATNTGNIDLTNVTVSDDKVATIFCPQNALEVGESMTCRASGVAVEGQYENIGTVIGSPVDGGPPVSDEDPSHYRGAEAEVVLKKKAGLTWSYTVENRGEVPLTELVFHVGEGVNVDCKGQTALNPGERLTCRATGPDSEYAKEITVSAKAVNDGTPVSTTVPATVEGAVDITTVLNEAPVTSFSAHKIPVDRQAHWTSTITNRGSSPLQLTKVLVKDALADDESGSALNCVATELAPSQSTTCEAVQDITKGAKTQLVVVEDSRAGIRTEDVAFYTGYERQQIEGLVYEAPQENRDTFFATSTTRRAPGKSGYPVKLYNGSNVHVGEIATDVAGVYNFSQLDPGDYYLVFTKYASETFAPPNQGIDETQDSDAVEEWDGRTHYFRIYAEGHKYPQTWDAGIVTKLLPPEVMVYLPLVTR